MHFSCDTIRRQPECVWCLEAGPEGAAMARLDARWVRYPVHLISAFLVFLAFGSRSTPRAVDSTRQAQPYGAAGQGPPGGSPQVLPQEGKRLEETEDLRLVLIQCESDGALSSPTLCNPIDCSLLGSPDHGILQARILEWVALSLLQGIFLTQGLNPGLPHGGQILYHLSHHGCDLGQLSDCPCQ